MWYHGKLWGTIPGDARHISVLERSSMYLLKAKRQPQMITLGPFLLLQHLSKISDYEQSQEYFKTLPMLFFFPFIFISWRLITLQYCSGFCHTLTWISHGFTNIPHPDPPPHLPLHPIPLGLPIWISSNEMDETGAHYTEWSKPER